AQWRARAQEDQRAPAPGEKVIEGLLLGVGQFRRRGGDDEDAAPGIARVGERDQPAHLVALLPERALEGPETLRGGVLPRFLAVSFDHAGAPPLHARDADQRVRELLLA